MAVPTVNAANAATVMIAVAGTGGRTVVPVGNVVTIVGTIAGMIAVTGARAAKAGAAPSAPTAGMTAAVTAERAAGQAIAATHSAPAQNGTASDIPPRSAPGSVRNG